MKTLHPKYDYNKRIASHIDKMEDMQIDLLAYARLLAMETDLKEKVQNELDTNAGYKITMEELQSCKDTRIVSLLSLWQTVKNSSAKLEDYFSTTPEGED